MALTKSSTVIVNDVSQTAGAATVTGSDQDITAAYQTIIRVRFTNGATGPTVPCQCIVQISEDTTTGNYMAIATVSGGSVNSAVSEFLVIVPDAAEHLRVVYGSQTGQAVTLRVVLEKITAV